LLEDDETGAEPAELDPNGLKGLVSTESVFVEFAAAGSPPKRSIVERCCDLVIQ